jgi:hypothetical protein
MFLFSVDVRGRFYTVCTGAMHFFYYLINVCILIQHNKTIILEKKPQFLHYDLTDM